jgi:hypothetical protein
MLSELSVSAMTRQRRRTTVLLAIATAYRRDICRECADNSQYAEMRNVSVDVFVMLQSQALSCDSK